MEKKYYVAPSVREIPLMIEGALLTASTEDFVWD